MVGIVWLVANKASCGSMCYIQGSLKVLGDPGTSMFNLAIAVHTFLVIALRWSPPRNFLIPIAVVVLSWGYRIILYVVIVVSEQPDIPAFQPTPYWCWVGTRWIIPSFYLWLWACVGGAVVLYIPLFLVIRGNLEIDPSRVWRMRLRRAPTAVERFGDNFSPSEQSRKMLAYPIVYIVTSVPYSVVRWTISGFSGETVVSSPLWFACVAGHYLEGLANVLLLTFTRPSILGFEARAPRNRRIIEDDSEPRFNLHRRGEESETHMGTTQDE
ncbi:hypothetical protein EXIGLDRAFT_769194 [Exidia glandulosa HHB12029]|uniref:Glucose receptor Git3 N-terminal domain-containing protein n=1 Tax=Exidia glandulosa HHB12029 TaxID=1314781 RepID=A0A165HN87_EXIGL|nr:hypothetical protein EXIGLDRAFT_769194 [Exidia glandulosa HHB12029]